jgi:PPOX class probable FMN-dependent enzyme
MDPALGSRAGIFPICSGPFFVRARLVGFGMLPKDHMTPITTIEALEALYDDAVPRSLTKVAREMTPLYAEWIAAARFVVLSTVGPEGTDASPRGDDGPVVELLGPHQILLPDWRGNNRIDSLRNIVRDPRVSLMFMVGGCNNVVRVNGRAQLTADAGMTQRFEQRGRHPKCVIMVEIDELYFQCAKAIMRSGLWTQTADISKLPTAGQFLKEREAGFDSLTYDTTYAEHAKEKMW